MIKVWTVFIFSFLLATSAASNELLLPKAEYEPGKVVALQLDALRQNDRPYVDAGIAQVWAFAHPDNKKTTGPLPRFARMIKGPAYQIMVNHRDHVIKQVSRTEAEAVYAVTVAGADGRVAGFRWFLRKSRSGPHAGAWLTIAVSAPVPLAKEI